MFKNWMLRKEYELKNGEVTEGWRTLHNRNCRFRTPRQIREDEMGGHIASDRGLRSENLNGRATCNTQAWI